LNRKKIIFLTYRFPFPLIGGDRIKSYFLLKHLAKSHDVTLVSFNFHEKPQKQHIQAVRNLGVDVEYVILNPVMAGLGSLLRLHRKYPLEISFFTRPEFRQKVDEIIEKKGIDLGISFFMRTSEYLKKKNFKKILISEDCRVMYQSRSFERSGESLKQKMVRWWEVRKLQKYEPRIVDYFDAVTLVTKEDIEGMKSLNPDGKYRLVTNGVDLDNYKPAESFDLRKDIIFIGRLDVWANTMMAQKIAREIMPKIWDKFPEIKLNIVGAFPPPSVKALQNERVKIHANVPDIKPFYSEARLFIHPHSGASGIQNKLLEALASGCPVVTTPTGNQGIYARHGVEAMIAENEEQLSRHALELLTNDKLARGISANARKLIEDTHSWEVVFGQIDGVIEEIFDE
jgi:sugar transferase (PEP-CTERM/EpsH1 system associated)